jgi:hypothetical protein
MRPKIKTTIVKSTTYMSHQGQETLLTAPIREVWRPSRIDANSSRQRMRRKANDSVHDIARSNVRGYVLFTDCAQGWQ